jgi:hypothetical protein
LGLFCIISTLPYFIYCSYWLLLMKNQIFSLFGFQVMYILYELCIFNCLVLVMIDE